MINLKFNLLNTIFKNDLSSTFEQFFLTEVIFMKRPDFFVLYNLSNNSTYLRKKTKTYKN